MPDMTEAGVGGPRPVRPTSRSYDTPRWRDEGQLLTDPRKRFVRKAVERSTGRKAVLKHVDKARGDRAKRRFYDEAVNMRRLNGTSGILPVWDIDDAAPDEPGWYAMPPAQLLADALGDDTTLRDVVEQIVVLADVLAHLAEHDTYHRDIKPDNLFWWDDGPVLADFGIAAWGPGASRAPEAGLTLIYEKVGPANFIAPEMRYNRPTDRGKRADVYSLAKTLFVLALPMRGPYPPDGTHHAEVEEFSLWETGGGGNSLPELRHVLEAATEFNPRRRLSMTDFRDELSAWISRNADVEFRPRGERPRFRFGWEAMHGRPERLRRDMEETRSMMRRSTWKIAHALTGDPDAEFEEPDRAGEILGDYEWEPNTEDDGYIPDGTIWMSTTFHEGRRIVLEAILDEGDTCFIAESHTIGPPLSLERSWGPTEWVRARMPRTADLTEKLADDIVDWLTANGTSGYAR